MKLTSRRRFTIIAVAASAAAVATAGTLWWRHHERAAFVASHLPARPDFAGWTDELVRRVTDCEQLIQSGHGAGAALVELASLYHANGFYAEALRCYDILEQLEPREPRWLHRRATILAGFGEIEPALACWQRVAALDPKYLPARLRLGDLFIKSNRLTEASAVYAEVLKQAPDEPYALLGLARCDFQAGRWDAARERLEKVVGATNYNLGYDLIVTVYERLGRDDLAAAIRGKAKASGAYRDPTDPWLDSLNEDCLDPYRLALTAGAAQRVADSATAVRLLDRAIGLSPKDATLHFQLGGIFLETQVPARAREQFEICTRLAPDFADGWAQLAGLFDATGDHAAAESTVISGLRSCPRSPGLHMMRGRHLREAGHLEEAVEEFRISIRLRPNEADAYVDFASVCFNLDRVTEGVDALQTALRVEPEHPGALSILAFHAIQTGDETAARQWMKRVQNQPRVAHGLRERLLAAYREQFGHPFD